MRTCCCRTTRQVFGSGIIGVCDVCGTRQAVIILQKERFKLCVLDFLNKSWVTRRPSRAPRFPPYRSDRISFDTAVSKLGPLLGDPPDADEDWCGTHGPDHSRCVRRYQTVLLDAAIRFAKDGCEVLIPEVKRRPGYRFSGSTSPLGPEPILAGGMSLSGSSRTRKLVLYFQDALNCLRSRPMADAGKTALFGIGFGARSRLGVAGEEQKLTAVVLVVPSARASVRLR